MVEKIIIFILFLGPLVFFHELGHYLFARLFGVRVETFSIGFGPKLFRFRRKETEYVISAIPLGGYVKMFGDDPLNKDAIPVEERQYSFTYKSKWARFWIVIGGPLANFILAYVIFFGLLIGGEKVPEIRLGLIAEKSDFYNLGLRSGDILTEINGKKILNPTDVSFDENGQISAITVVRNNVPVSLPVKISGDKFLEQFANHPPILREALVVNKDGKIFGLSLSDKGMNQNDSLESLGHLTTDFVYIYETLPDQEQSKDSAKDAKDVLEEKPLSFREMPIDKFKLDQVSLEHLLEKLSSLGYRPLDLMVKSVNMNSPADKHGLRAKDVLLKLEGKNVYSFSELRDLLQNINKESVQLELWSGGKVKSMMFTPELKEVNGKQTKLIGVYTAGRFAELKFVQTESQGIIGSAIVAFDRTLDSFFKTVDGFKKLITAEVSLKNIGGPLAIGKVASDSFNTSLSYFFQLMALISVNLGVINLFPIPVLDGGHIMFIILEMLNGGPISRRKMEIAQQVGLSLLLMLMVGAMFNDFSRFF